MILNRLKPTFLLSGILAASVAVCLVQWQRIRHLDEETVRAEQRLSSGSGRTSGASATGTTADMESELRDLLRQGNVSPGESVRKDERILELLGRIEPAALARVLQELEKDPQFYGQSDYILWDYAQFQPREAYFIARELPQKYINTDGIFQYWAHKEPAEALEWMRSEEEGDPEKNPKHYEMMESICAGLADKDPRAAIAAILNDDWVGPSEVGGAIGGTFEDPQKAKAFFEAMDELSAADPSKKAEIDRIREGAAARLASLFENQSFTDATALIDACFTPEEKLAFVKEQNIKGYVAEPGKWADWLMTVEPPSEKPAGTGNEGEGNEGAFVHPLVTRMKSWADENPNAAAEWIGKMPDGPLKQDTIAAYAEGVQQRDPARAAEWALQLPDDEHRGQLLGKILTTWEKTDPAAARAFREGR